MLSQTDAVKQAWTATDRTLDIIVTVDGKDYQATEINSLTYDAGAFTGDTLGIGSTYENSVTIEFSSVVEAFKQGLTVLPKVGVLVNGKFEYTSLGTFIISEVNRDRNNNLTTIKALDQMCKLEGQYKPTVSDTASPLDIIADIANQGGVTVNTGELQHLPALPNIKRIEGQTLRTAIGWVAQLYGGFAAFDRDGNLTIRTTASPDYTITPGEYQQGGLTKNEVAYETGGIKVTVNIKKTDDSGQEVDDTTTLQAGETTGSQIELTNDSMTNDLLTTVWTGIKDITYYPYTLNWFGNPNLEVGDWVTLTDTQGNQFNVPVNQYTMSFNGGLESTISATQSSSTAGGYAYTGSAGSIKNMIEALQVRHTASGNNVYPPSYQGQPQNPKKGDVWYKQNGNNIEVWIYQEDGDTLSWVRAPIDGEVKADLQALGTKTNEDLTRVKNELSSEAESQWQSMKTATSEVASDLSATKANLSAVSNDLSATKTSLADTRDSLATTTNDLSSVKTSLADTRNNLATTTSDLTSVKADLADTKNNLTTTTNDIKNSLSAVSSDLSATKTNLEDTKNSLSTTVEDLQKQTGQLSGSLSTANSKIEFNSNAIAEVKHTAEEISTTVSNIRVGGRNLLRNSDKLPYSGNHYSFWSTGQWRIAVSALDADNMKRTNKEIIDPPQGDKVTGISFTGILQPSVSDISLVAIDGVPVSGDVTVSFWARQTSNVDTAFVSANWGGERPANVVNTNASTEIWGTASYPYRKLFLPKDGSWTRFWATFNVNDKDIAYIGAGNTGTSAEVQICLVKIETGTMATDWTPAPEDTDQAISKVSQTADAIRADLANTKGDVASVKVTANSLQSQITDNKNNISSVKQTADSLTTSMTNAEGNISSLQATASGLQSDVADQSGKISQLQQDTEGLNFTVANGSQNLILNSGNPSTLEHWWYVTGTTRLDKHSLWKNGTENLFVLSNTSSTDKTSFSSDYFQIEPNQTYTLSFYAFNNSALTTASVLYRSRKAGSSDVFDAEFRLADSVRFSESNAQYIKLTFNSGDYNEGYIRFENNASTTEGTAAELWLTDIQLEKGSIATAWHPSPGDIAQLKITADGLTSKVADTQGDVSNLKITANTISTDLTNAKGDIASVKATADSLTSSMTNAQGDISNLQLKADSITSTLSNGGVNLLNNSQGNFQPKNSVISNWQTFQGVDVYMTQGKKYTVSAQAAPGFVFSGTHDATAESNRITLWLTDLPNKNLWQMISSDTTDVSQGGTYFTWNHASGTYTLCVNSYKKDNSGYAHHVQIEYGDTATPWKPSNGDISSLQQTAGGLTTRVSNTEGNISSLQETAKELKATVGDDNTGLVSYVKAIPGQISSAITASKQATVIASAVDVHDMKTAGYYLLKGTLTNSPVDAWAYLRVITSDSGDRVYHQIWKDVSSTVYTEYWAGGWSDWATHIDSDNLKSNVITAINQSTEGVSITGSKITLDGNVNVTPGFTFSADHIKAGTLMADQISGGKLNFSKITVEGLTANSISSGSISGQNLNINLDNGVVEFTKGNLHSTDGGFNISIDTKSFYLDTGNGSKLWIDSNGFHLQESASQHLWMNKDGLHNYTDANGNGIQINDTTLKVLNSSNAGLIAKDGIIQFSANPIWNSDNVYSGGTLDSQTYGTIGFNSNLLSSSLNGIFIRGREGVVMGTNSYNGGVLLNPDDIIPSVGGAGINLPEGANNPASIFTNSVLTLYGGSRYSDGTFNDQMPYISIGCNWYYTHNGTFMTREGTNDRNAQMYAKAKTISFDAADWINLRSLGGAGRIALDAQYVHSYPTYNQTTSAGANVYVAPDGALIRSSSARKYKTDIQDADNDYGAKLIEFAPQKWIDKAEKKRYEEDPDNNKKPGYYYGLIADDLDAAGLDMLVNYGADGEVEGINYDRLAVALLPVIKSLKGQVASLKEQLKALTK